MGKRIAILLTCHNRKENTLACLEKLYQIDLPFNFSFDVFLVDDGSTDGTAKAVNDNFHDVREGSSRRYLSRPMSVSD